MRLRLAAACLILVIIAGIADSCIVDAGRIDLHINVDGPDGKPLPCRVHVYDAAGKPQTAPGLLFWRDHFVCGGRVALQLAPGKYRYEIERGPEWRRSAGALELKDKRDHTLHVHLQRLANLQRLGWYAGDLHIHRPVQDIELLMQAEDLHIAPVITWWNTQNAWATAERPKELLRRFDRKRFYHLMAGEDERGGGALLYFHLQQPLPITKASREFPASLKFAEVARKLNKDVWIDIEKPFWWDLVVWLASGLMDSVGVANNHMCRSSMYAGEAWGRPRDERRLPPPRGNGQWTQEIYYHILNCGLRLPPSAGSASGVLPNPVGYNRVYVHVPGELDYQAWWTNLKAGRCFVSNGPLLLCPADGHHPGHVFRGDAGKPLNLRLDVHLITQDRVPKLEVIHNGRVVREIPLPDDAEQRRALTLSITESGWFLVRAVTDNKLTYRFASTGPFYVEIGDTPRRVSKKSAQFFLDWSNERIDRLREVKMSPDERREVIEVHERARQFWQDLVKRANAD